MSASTDFSLEPLALEAEFEAEDQEHDQHREVDEPPNAIHDELNLSSDPHITRFFDTIEGHHLPMREVLLLSCHAHQRQVDEALLRESRRPVVQGRRQPSVDVAAAASQTPAQSSPPALPFAAHRKLLSRDRVRSPSEHTMSPTSSESGQSSSPPPVPQTKLASSWANWFKKQKQNRDRLQSMYSPSSESASPPVASPSRGLPISHQTATDQERAARAPTAPEPEPCTIVLSNLALYIFPPAIAVEMDSAEPSGAASASSSAPSVKYFLVYNEYERIALQDLLLVSLPYRMGLTRHGTDFALRITDFALHQRDGETTTWLQAPRNKRSRIVECISDAFVNLMGLALEMQQVDYSELIESCVGGSVWHAIRDMQLHRWATLEYLTAGYLFHRSVHVWPTAVPTHKEQVSAPTTAATAVAVAAAVAAPAPATAVAPTLDGIELKMAPPSEWKKSWFVLSKDNYLLHFISPQELEAFQYVATANSAAAHTKLPASFDRNQIDLSKSLYLRGASARSEGFEIIVYPRTSSMHVAMEGDLMQLGYTRHLFRIPLPHTQLPTQVTSPPPASAPMPSSPDAAATAQPTRSAALTAYMEHEVNRWLRALRSAMQGPGLSPVSLLAAQQASASGEEEVADGEADGGVFGRQTPVDLRVRAASLSPDLDADIVASPEPVEAYALAASTAPEVTSPTWPPPPKPFLVEEAGPSSSPSPAACASPEGPDLSSSPLNEPVLDLASPQVSPEPAPTLP